MGDVNHLTVQQKKNDNLENKRAWEKTADKYIKNCHKFEITIDSSVLIALQTGCDFCSFIFCFFCFSMRQYTPSQR